MTEINMIINDGKAFFAHETTINFTAAQISFDFKSVSPRVDPRSSRDKDCRTQELGELSRQICNLFSAEP